MFPLSALWLLVVPAVGFSWRGLYIYTLLPVPWLCGRPVRSVFRVPGLFFSRIVPGVNLCPVYPCLSVYPFIKCPCKQIVPDRLQVPRIGVASDPRRISFALAGCQIGGAWPIGRKTPAGSALPFIRPLSRLPFPGKWPLTLFAYKVPSFPAIIP